MAPLSSDQRKLLEKAIISARQSAEAGAKNALEMLAVDRHEPHASMSTEDRALRNRLRARGRQLGDVRDKVKGTQAIDRLVHEVAYEYWHRMLFARFLIENHLLIEPNSGVAISMEECEELAREADEEPRSMAARFAQDSLPQIFRVGDPVLDVTFAPETRQELDKVLDSLPDPVFTADDSLGWTYQYWQKEKKDSINESGTKIGADELPAVTQLFTEHYMVRFLYHNTIGAWHAGKVLAENPSLVETAKDEDELRNAVRLQSKGGYDFEHLRFVRGAAEGDDENVPSGPWHPAAGNYESWPKEAQKLRVIDPCCGSGHFLTEGFELLVRLRMDEEGHKLEDAVCRVLRDNLFGLELDPRCTQIAAFNLAIAAWKMAGQPFELPTINIACSGLAVGSTKEEWTAPAGDNRRIRNSMEQLYELFEQAPELGSLIDPKALSSDLYTAGIGELQPYLELALVRESSDAEDTERAVAAHGMARAAEFLLGEYTLAISNVPFLGIGKQSAAVAALNKWEWPEARHDTATRFLSRSRRLAASIAFVTPSEWTYTRRYRGYRKKLLKHLGILHVSFLGKKAFKSAIRVDPILMIGQWEKTVAGISIIESAGKGPGLVAADLKNKSIATIDPMHVLSDPDQRISPNVRETGTSIGDHCDVRGGLKTGADVQYIRNVWEINLSNPDWIPLQTTVGDLIEYGGRSRAILWEGEEGSLAALAASVRHLNHSAQNWRKGKPLWGRIGLTLSLMGDLPTTVYAGDAFDCNCMAIVPEEQSNLLPLLAYGLSGALSKAIRSVDRSLKLDSTKTVLKIPFDLKHWEKAAEQKYPNGIPEPQSDDPTQWLFHGHPAKAKPSTVLQVAVGRLLGYEWPPELNPEMHLADEAREWVNRCGPLKELSDDDGIVCLSATRGERFAADRLREILSSAFGSDWSVAKERELLTNAGDGRSPSRSLETWLRDRFFEEHCKLFNHRPFLWHIWDGNQRGFHCLVNSHKLMGPDGEGRRTLEAITYSYLGDWIDRQKAAQAEGEEGADSRLTAAQDLQGQLVKILEGEPPYDLFVRWKPLHEQSIGWEPNINDGVRLNVRPFMNAKLRSGGKKGAGILRWKPNIKWKKDRGKDPQVLRPKMDFPWFWGCTDGAVDFSGDNDFDGNRWNDLHYSIAFKKTARERAAERKK